MNMTKMATFIQSALFLMTSVFIVYVLGEERQQYARNHLCTKALHVTHPVPVRQSYTRPVYRNGRMTYQVAYRTVFRMKARARFVTGCCPGWEKRGQDDSHCSSPVCKYKCEHGKCIAPDVCMCDTGFSGHKCHIELDECTGRHKCQQKCVNTVGSYECACHDGFVLADDKRSCNLCLMCTPEFKQMQAQVMNLTQKIDMLEEEKQSLQSNLTTALSQYEEAVSAFREVTRALPSSTTPSVFGPYQDHNVPLDRLASLSEQISILEEHMTSCCNAKRNNLDYYG